MDAPAVPAVGPDEANELVAAGAVLLDVRLPDEWEVGHAPQALHVPLAELGARYQSLAVDRRIVAVCRTGARSEKAAAALLGAGYDVVNLAGGMKAWAAVGLPLVTDTGDAGRVL